MFNLKKKKKKKKKLMKTSLDSNHDSNQIDNSNIQQGIGIMRAAGWSPSQQLSIHSSSEGLKSDKQRVDYTEMCS